KTLSKARTDNRKDREKIAADAIARLVTRIPRVGLLVHETSADLTIRIDAIDVPRPEWSAVSLDPGAHHIEASAMARASWQADITVAEGQATTFDVPALSPLAPEP